MSFFTSFLLINFSFSLALVLNAHLAFARLFEHKFILWLLVILFSQFYVLVRIAERSFGLFIPSWLYFFSACAMGIFLVAVFSVFVVDLFIVIFRLLPPLKPIYAFLRAHSVQVGFVVLGLIFIQFCYGYYLGISTKPSYYTLSMPVKKDFRIVQISDIHVTSYTSVSWLNSLVDKVNAENPDLVVITGDIVDGGVEPYLDKNVGDIMGKINSTYGVYGVMGNHDYHGDWKRAIEAFNVSINMLFDEAVEFTELGINLVGRDDYRSRGIRNSQRASITDMLANLEPSYPAIVLDHQPRDVMEPIAAGAKLQFSGHTHNGQVFPANLVVKRMYINPWGLWQNRGFSLLVSCGVGTWGPVIRTTSRSEIVVVDIKAE